MQNGRTSSVRSDNSEIRSLNSDVSYGLHRGACEVMQKAVVLQGYKVILTLWDLNSCVSTPVSTSPICSLWMPTQRCGGCPSPLVLRNLGAHRFQGPSSSSASILNALPCSDGHPMLSSTLANVPLHVMLTAVHLLRCSMRLYRFLSFSEPLTLALDHLLRSHNDWCQAMALDICKWLMQQNNSLPALPSNPLPLSFPPAPAPAWSSGPTAERSVPTAQLKEWIAASFSTERWRPSADEGSTSLYITFPELHALDIRICTSPAQHINRGCPHQWFCHTLTSWLLMWAVEHHAAVWYPRSLLRRCWVLWMRQKGMRMLLRLRDTVPLYENELSSEGIVHPPASLSSEPVLHSAEESTIAGVSCSIRHSKSMNDGSFYLELPEGKGVEGHHHIPRSSSDSLEDAQRQCTLKEKMTEQQWWVLRRVFVQWMSRATREKALLETFQVNQKMFVCRKVLTLWAFKLTQRLLVAKKKAESALLREIVRRRTSRTKKQLWALWHVQVQCKQFHRQHRVAGFFSQWRSKARYLQWKRANPAEAAEREQKNSLLKQRAITALFHLWVRKMRIANAVRWRNTTLLRTVCHRFALRGAAHVENGRRLQEFSQCRLQHYWKHWLRHWQWLQLLRQCDQLRRRGVTATVWSRWTARLWKRREHHHRDTASQTVEKHFQWVWTASLVLRVWKRRMMEHQNVRLLQNATKSRALRAWKHLYAQRMKRHEKQKDLAQEKWENCLLHRCFDKWKLKKIARVESRHEAQRLSLSHQAHHLYTFSKLSSFFFQWKQKQQKRHQLRKWKASSCSLPCTVSDSDHCLRRANLFEGHASTTAPYDPFHRPSDAALSLKQMRSRLMFQKTKSRCVFPTPSRTVRDTTPSEVASILSDH